MSLENFFLVAGLVLFLIEVLTPIPTFGVAGTLGILFLSGVLWMGPEWSLRFPPVLWIPVAVIGLVFTLYLGMASSKAIMAKDRPKDLNGLLGQTGRVTRVMKGNRLKVKTAGSELWNAKNVGESEGALSDDQEVLIVGFEGFTLLVRTVNDGPKKES